MYLPSGTQCLITLLNILSRFNRIKSEVDYREEKLIATDIDIIFCPSRCSDTREVAVSSILGLFDAILFTSKNASIKHCRTTRTSTWSLWSQSFYWFSIVHHSSQRETCSAYFHPQRRFRLCFNRISRSFNDDEFMISYSRGSNREKKSFPSKTD